MQRGNEGTGTIKTDHRGTGIFKTGPITGVQALSKQDWSQGYRHNENWTDYRSIGVIKTGLVTGVQASSKLD